MIQTWEAVLWSQIPLGIACIIAAIELYRFRKKVDELVDVLKERNEIAKK